MAALIVVASAVAYVVGAALIADYEAIDFLYAGMLAAFGATGVVITRRVRRNPIGWLSVGCAVAAALAHLSHALAERTGSGVLGAYASASWVPLMLPGVTFLPLLFPDGRVLTRRWYVIALADAVGILTVFLATFLRPGPLEDFPETQNPLGVAGAEALEGVGFAILLVGVFGGIASLTLRFRRADRLERQQIRWLAAAAVAAALALVAGLPLLAAGVPQTPVFAAMMAGVLALPVAAAVAIVRYRLYDIDVVINRALVYTALTVTLAATYLVAVLLLQLVLPERSDLAVAASTLAVAAAFGPARRRIQSAVDRRFFRRRYDTARTMLSFGARLRGEVDLGSVSRELTDVATETMEPAHVSLWLRGS